MEVEILDVGELVTRNLAEGLSGEIVLNLPVNLAEMMWIIERRKKPLYLKKKDPFRELYLLPQEILSPESVLEEKRDIELMRGELARYVRNLSVPILPTPISRGKNSNDISRNTADTVDIILRRFSDDEHYYRRIEIVSYALPLNPDLLWGE